MNAGIPTSTGDPFSAGAREPESGSLKAILAKLAILAGWSIVFGLSYARAMRWSGGVQTPEAIGYAAGGVLTAALVGAVIVWVMDRARKVKMSALHKQTLMVSFATGIALVSLAGEASHDRTTPKDHISHLVKQAAGKEASTGEGQWYDGPVREFYRELLETNQKYSEALASQDQSELKTVYTPQSYATREGMQKAIEQLKGVLEVDKKFESIDQVMEDFEKNIQASSASAFQKEEFLKGFHSTADKSFAPRAETFRTEEEWLQSTIDLYQFTLDHFDGYKIQAKKLIFAKEDVREQFQNMQSKSLALHKTALEAKTSLDASRRQALGKAGIKPEDIDNAAKR